MDRFTTLVPGPNDVLSNTGPGGRTVSTGGASIRFSSTALPAPTPRDIDPRVLDVLEKVFAQVERAQSAPPFTTLRSLVTPPPCPVPAELAPAVARAKDLAARISTLRQRKTDQGSIVAEALERMKEISTAAAETGGSPDAKLKAEQDRATTAKATAQRIAVQIEPVEKLYNEACRSVLEIENAATEAYGRAMATAIYHAETSVSHLVTEAQNAAAWLNSMLSAAGQWSDTAFAHGGFKRSGFTIAHDSRVANSIEESARRARERLGI